MGNCLNNLIQVIVYVGYIHSQAKVPFAIIVRVL
jgi:hypothetical protein